MKTRGQHATTPPLVSMARRVANNAFSSVSNPSLPPRVRHATHDAQDVYPLINHHTTTTRRSQKKPGSSAEPLAVKKGRVMCPKVCGRRGYGGWEARGGRGVSVHVGAGWAWAGWERRRARGSGALRRPSEDKTKNAALVCSHVTKRDVTGEELDDMGAETKKKRDGGSVACGPALRRPPARGCQTAAW